MRAGAIRAHTIGGANATGEEAITGSIEPGKLADLIVLDRDWPTGDDEASRDRRDTMVEPTMLGGEWV